MSNYPLLNAIGKTSQNILWEVSNSVLIGIPEGIKKTFNDIHHNSKLSNEALYFLQVKTFLETADLSEDEVNNFMNDNPDNLRLGLEIFKILENTIIEKQARMLAKAFKLYATEIMSRSDFDKYTYIIAKFNNHLINEIEKFFEYIKDFKPQIHYTANKNITGVSAGLNSYFVNPNMDLVSFGFLEEVYLESVSTTSQVSQFQRTKFFYYFYENIFKD